MSDQIASKQAYADVEHAESKSLTSEEAINAAIARGDDLDPVVVRKLLRKIDWRLMPGLGLLYAVSLIDRVNLSVVSRVSHPLSAVIAHRPMADC